MVHTFCLRRESATGALLGLFECAHPQPHAPVILVVALAAVLRRALAETDPKLGDRAVFLGVGGHDLANVPPRLVPDVRHAIPGLDAPPVLMVFI